MNEGSKKAIATGFFACPDLAVEMLFGSVRGERRADPVHPFGVHG